MLGVRRRHAPRDGQARRRGLGRARRGRRLGSDDDHPLYARDLQPQREPAHARRALFLGRVVPRRRWSAPRYELGLGLCRTRERNLGSRRSAAGGELELRLGSSRFAACGELELRLGGRSTAASGELGLFLGGRRAAASGELELRLGGHRSAANGELELRLDGRSSAASGELGRRSPSTAAFGHQNW